MKDTNRNFKIEKKLLKNPLINNAKIYNLLGISRGLFHDKLNGKNGARFTDTQKNQITKILKKLGKQLLLLTQNKVTDAKKKM